MSQHRLEDPAHTQDEGERRTTRKKITSSELAIQLIGLMRDQVYNPGDRLIEQEIADRFSVSRGPVREALRILEAKGVVHIEPMRGATVTRISDQQAVDAIEISAALFALASRFAAERGNEQERITIERKADRLAQLAQQSVTPRAFFLETLDIGCSVIDAAHSSLLDAEIMQIRMGAPNIFGPLGFSTKPVRKRAARNWIALSQAIRNGDAKKAEKLAITLHNDARVAASQVSA